jgi:tetratricopeptide repeat protein/DUF2914 family protein
MSELQEARHLVERAEQAAMSANFAAADELLKKAARIQEKELGPNHPDLAKTLNNLAILAEKTGRTTEAEPLYRRAATIAAAALPPDHPMVVESRQNLADFCMAHGVPLEVPAALTPAAETDSDVTAVAPQVQPEPPSAPIVAPERSHSRAWLAVAAGFVVVLVVLIFRPGSSIDVSIPVRPPESGEARPVEPATQPTTAPPDKPAAERKEPSKAPQGAITLATAQVCRNFSTSGRTWRCEPVESSVKAGPLVLYTRVKSARNTAVVHRWYQGNALRQSVKLGIQGNANEGYRTYSRQTVHDGEWRVEVRSADGALLHEQRFVVR